MDGKGLQLECEPARRRPLLSGSLGREGLDAISIIDHIEYQPHKQDVPTNHNRPYEIAVRRAQEKNILLVKGAEITRDTPPGYFNAIFLEPRSSGKGIAGKS